MDRRVAIIWLVLITSLSASAQVVQRFSGQLKDEFSGQPVSNATVFLSNADTLITALSDAEGTFVLENLPPGHYSLLVKHLGYKPYYEPEVLLEASKNPYRNFYLQESVQELEEVEVSGEDVLPPFNRREFTVAQTQRYPATFFDPARLVQSQPGVSPANDQGNHIVVHGLSPAGIQWRLGGLPILNPNHLNNAGTRRDRSSISGGGVNMFSGQLMANSSFQTGALPPRLGNALSGVFDIRFRPGNLQEREHTLQASLLGIDLATEGPIKKGASSYLLNYRYSTVGILSQLGVSFGGEEIQFQDISANVVFEESPLGELSLFLLAGMSSNKLSPLDSAEWERDKNRQSILFEGRMGGVGLNQSASLGSSSRWQNGLAISLLENTRSESWLGPRQPLENRAYDAQDAQQLSAYSRLLHSFSTQLNVEAGMQLISRWSDVQSYTVPARGFDLDKSLAYHLLQPYLQAIYTLGPKLELTAGLRYSYLSEGQNSRWEPFGSLRWEPTLRQQLQLHYGRQSQVSSDFQLARIAESPVALENLMDSHYLGLGWSSLLREKTTVSAELFYQWLEKLPASGNDLLINSLTPIDLALTGAGNASTYGLDLQLNRSFYRGWYTLLSGSLFDARYKGANGEEHHSPFNSQWVLSGTAGKEWTNQKANALRTVGLHLRLLSRGGYWYTPIDISESKAAQREVLLWEEPYSQQLPAYYSLDVRVSHTREKAGYTRIWSLDIQNVTGRENLGWYYYDFFSEEVKAQYQLGLIPVIAYRIQF